ncbi:hypothetical protein EMIT0P176_80123 [Pseudomonas sp. IT-P176]
MTGLFYFFCPEVQGPARTASSTAATGDWGTPEIQDESEAAIAGEPASTSNQPSPQQRIFTPTYVDREHLATITHALDFHG